MDFPFFPSQKILRRNAAWISKIKKDWQGRNGEQPSAVSPSTRNVFWHLRVSFETEEHYACKIEEINATEIDAGQEKKSTPKKIEPEN